MKKLILLLSVYLIFYSCKNTNQQTAIVQESQQISSVETFSYEQLKPLLQKNDGKTYIINFWATWCSPCVKELPYFEKINKEYVNKNVEVILVSLDFPKQIEKKLIPYINKNLIKSKVILLDDINEDIWIKAIDESWSGAIPATIIYNSKNRKFYEQSFDYETLENELNFFLKP